MDAGLEKCLKESIKAMRKKRAEKDNELRYCMDCKKYYIKEYMVHPAWRKGFNLMCPDCFNRISIRKNKERC